jgi:hypothetical protein
MGVGLETIAPPDTDAGAGSVATAVTAPALTVASPVDTTVGR